MGGENGQRADRYFCRGFCLFIFGQHGVGMIKWTDRKGAWANGVRGRQKQVWMFTVIYDACVKKGDPNVYKLTCRLPGVKPEIGHFETMEQAKERGEYVYGKWIELAGLTEKEQA